MEIHIYGYDVIRKRSQLTRWWNMHDFAFTPAVSDEVSNKYELLFIELLLPKTKPIIGTYYRPPNQ